MKRCKIGIVLFGLSCIEMPIHFAFANDANTADVGKIHVKAQAVDTGLMVQDDAPKSRSTVTHEALEKQNATGNGIDKLKYTPGILVSSNDDTGLSGFKFEVRGMNASQIGVTMDGVPINDSGNYAMYPNLLGDPENLEEIFVNQGTNDTDSPNIGSSGGNVGLISLRPTKKHSVFFKQTIGNHDLKKTFIRLNTGNIHGFQTYLSASRTLAHKWKGAGKIRADKVELNSLWQQGGNSVNTIIKWHKQEAIQYLAPTKSVYSADHKVDFPTTVSTCTASNGAKYICGNYYGVSQNPFENITASLRGIFQLNNDLTLTVIPYYYVSNGGGAGDRIATLNSGTYNGGGVYDLSNLNSKSGYQQDGVLTSGNYYRPSWTETWRPGITTKFDWAVNDTNKLTFGIWYERARERQSKPYIALLENGHPSDVWANYDQSNEVKDANGKTIQGRNYYTVTPSQKYFMTETWNATDNLTLIGGLSYEHVSRKGHNRGSLGDTPENKQVSYNKILPTARTSYQLTDNNSLFYNISENMRVPSNYALYDSGDSIHMKPETSWNNELGWRYQTNDLNLSASLFNLAYSNRQISTKNADNEYITKNIGKVVNRGVELELGGKLPHYFNFYTSYTYTRAKQKSDIIYKGTALPTKGKQVAGVPYHLLNLVLGYDDGTYYGSVADRIVGKQYGDMANEESIPGYGIINLSLGYRIPYHILEMKKPTIRLSVNNLFNREYLSGVDSSKFAAKRHGSYNQSPDYLIGEERSLEVSFETMF